MLVVVVYDVPDDKRRLKLSKLLEGYGRRVQFSVFECFLTLEEMRKLHGTVAKKVKPDDDIRFYWITEDAVGRVLTLGSKPPEGPPNAFIF